jgi:hypothetical protein
VIPQLGQWTRVRRGGGLRPDDDHRRVCAPDGFGQGAARHPATEHPGGHALFSQGGRQHMQGHGVLLLLGTGQQHRGVLSRLGQRRRDFRQDVTRCGRQDVLDIDEAARPEVLVAYARNHRNKKVFPGTDDPVASHRDADDLRDQASVQAHRRGGQLAHQGRSTRDGQIPVYGGIASRGTRGRAARHRFRGQRGLICHAVPPISHVTWNQQRRVSIR